MARRSKFRAIQTSLPCSASRRRTTFRIDAATRNPRRKKLLFAISPSERSGQSGSNPWFMFVLRNDTEATAWPSARTASMRRIWAASVISKAKKVTRATRILRLWLVRNRSWNCGNCKTRGDRCAKDCPSAWLAAGPTAAQIDPMPRYTAAHWGAYEISDDGLRPIPDDPAPARVGRGWLSAATNPNTRILRPAIREGWLRGDGGAGRGRDSFIEMNWDRAIATAADGACAGTRQPWQRRDLCRRLRLGQRRAGFTMHNPRCAGF